MSFITWLIGYTILGVIFIHRDIKLKPFIAFTFIALAMLTLFSPAPFLLKLLSWVILGGVSVLAMVKPLRLQLVSKRLLGIAKHALPSMSETEAQAVHAGTVGWEGEFFKGKPNWDKLFGQAKPQLTKEEQDFLNGPCERVCQMTNDWQITHEQLDLSPEVWNYLKQEGFFGMIIPKEYGGKAFSAYAHSQVLIKLGSRSMTLASTVAVPNSLGPGELILHYGTKEQKEYYLPRLAQGREMPCFALTGPDSGSDATAMSDTGVVCHGTYQGKEMLGLKLNWDKRYITLAPVATVLGLAFRMSDPEGLLGEPKDYGITCALIPTNTPGVVIGRRHFPLNMPFQNGPTQGKDVFIPLDFIIGGVEMAGHGWRMLVECLSVGRSISLPSSTAGFSMLASTATGAYARIRRQFKTPIGHMEGVQEALARIIGNTYIANATRTFTTNAVDQGEKPAIASAIAKYHVTEIGRKVMNDAMDIHGGKGIMLGPKNYLGRVYQGVPIAITVEGANILTRNLIIFGQGALRSHPHLLNALEVLTNETGQTQLEHFDDFLFNQIGFTVKNTVKTIALPFTRMPFKTVEGENNISGYQKQLNHLSTQFAFVADICMLTLGGELKRKESISARLGDALSSLFIASTVLKDFWDHGQPADEAPVIHWCMTTLTHEAETQLFFALKNLPNKLLSKALLAMTFPTGRRTSPPTVECEAKVAKTMLRHSGLRARFMEQLHTPIEPQSPVKLLDQLMQSIDEADRLLKRIQTAISEERLVEAEGFKQTIENAVQAKLITVEEADLLYSYEITRQEIIAVDDFANEYLTQPMQHLSEDNQASK